jgi:hypothetical protein
MSRNGVTRISTLELLRLAQRLTDRDRMILSLVDKHRVLTTPQITQAAFDSQHTAAQRLRVLTGLGLLARFRPRRERGSAPWHYVLDSYGALVLAVERSEDPDTTRLRRDRQLAVATSSQLTHRLGISGFFTSLLEYSRFHYGAELARSRNGAEVGKWVEGIAPWQDSTVRPDAGGCWREQNCEMSFLLEWDNGSEPHRRLQEKIDRYAEFYEELERVVAAGARERIPWVLFCFGTYQREINAYRALSRSNRARSVPVATTHHVPFHSPAERVWRILNDEQSTRLRLSELPTMHESTRYKKGEAVPQ